MSNWTKKRDREVREALKSLAKKGLAKKVIINGKPEWSITIEGLREAIAHKSDSQQMKKAK